ncbi:hypothetical protein AA23498_0332 [Acetobacter nitrogenifigens DSM 23921 = NBRC 105050]|nr:hypothetical protein AA23498_0332 [Acetobacter nitrogenifigens DSM 23921 = NBRC 105050]
MFVNLGMALLLAIFLSERRSGFRYAVAIIALLCLVPKRDFYRGGSWPTDPFFTPAHIKAILPPDPVVLILPFGSIGPCMALQVDAGFNFRQSGGYLGYTPAEASADPLISALQQRRVDADFTDQLARHVKKYKIDAILITPETDPNLRKAVESIGWQSTSDGDVIIVRPFEKQ